MTFIIWLFISGYGGNNEANVVGTAVVITETYLLNYSI